MIKDDKFIRIGGSYYRASTITKINRHEDYDDIYFGAGKYEIVRNTEDPVERAVITKYLADNTHV